MKFLLFRKYSSIPLIFIVLFAVSCQVQRRPAKIVEKPAPAEAPKEGLYIFLNIIPKNPNSVVKLKKYFDNNQKFKAGITIPYNFLDNSPENTELAGYLKNLAAGRRISLYMRLKNEPVLPLIADNSEYLKSVGKNSDPSLFYRWPQDIRDQIALEMDSFKNFWGAEPMGFVPYGGMLDENSAKAVSHTAVELVFCGKTLISDNTLLKTGRFNIACVPEEINKLIYAAPVLTEGAVKPGKYEIIKPSGKLNILVIDENYLEEKNLKLDSVLDEIFSEFSIRNAEYSLPEEYIKANVAGFPYISFNQITVGSWRADDLSSWIGELEEDQAWQMLAKCRRALEEYKNSGSADIRRLDSAMQEIYAAGSGSYFYHFGNDSNSFADQQADQMFRAGLLNVYRLIKQSPPEELYQSVSLFKGGVVASASTDAAFEKGQDYALWTDPEADDNGDLTLSYPEISAVSDTAGLADLLSFGFKVSPEQITYQLKFKRLDNFWNAPAGFSFPLVDIYIDLNNRYGAGLSTGLNERGIYFGDLDAWEYAIVINGWGGRLYRSSSGGGIFKVSNIECSKIDDNTIAVKVPRSTVKGNPFNWGYGVVAMGYSRFAMKDPPVPMPVDKIKSESSFSSVFGANASPIVDIMLQSGQSQKEILKMDTNSKKIIVPMLRVQ